MFMHVLWMIPNCSQVNLIGKNGFLVKYGQGNLVLKLYKNVDLVPLSKNSSCFLKLERTNPCFEV